MKKNIVKIFYMWMFCITLKERNTKRFVKELAFPSHLRKNGHDFAYNLHIILFLYLLCSWIIAIFKECLNKSRNSPCLYRYQVTLIVLDYFLFSNNIMKDNKKCLLKKIITIK